MNYKYLESLILAFLLNSFNKRVVMGVVDVNNSMDILNKYVVKPGMDLLKNFQTQNDKGDSVNISKVFNENEISKLNAQQADLLVDMTGKFSNGQWSNYNNVLDELGKNGIISEDVKAITRPICNVLAANDYMLLKLLCAIYLSGLMMSILNYIRIRAILLIAVTHFTRTLSSSKKTDQDILNILENVKGKIEKTPTGTVNELRNVLDPSKYISAETVENVYKNASNFASNLLKNSGYWNQGGETK